MNFAAFHGKKLHYFDPLFVYRFLQEAWRKFSDMSHIMVADPDWEPAANFPYAELDFSHVAFMFKIWDRNSHTTRLSEVSVR